jgi:hypothetical protein
MPVTPHRDTKDAGTITVPIPLTHRVYWLFSRGLDTVEITAWLNERGGKFTEAQVYRALARALDDRYEGRA